MAIFFAHFWTLSGLCVCVCSIVDQTIHIILVADLVEREKVGEEGFSYFDHILLMVSSTPWLWLEQLTGPVK